MQKHNLPNTIDSLNGAIGNEIGSGNIRFIQDVGQKVEGVPYLDKNTNKLHLCITTTNSTDNDSNFIKFDLKESFNKLQNLLKIEAVSGTDYTGIKKYINKNTFEFLCKSSGGQYNKQIVLPTYVKEIIHISLGVVGNKDTSATVIYNAFIDKNIGQNSFTIVPRYTAGTHVQSEEIFFSVVARV